MVIMVAIIACKTNVYAYSDSLTSSQECNVVGHEGFYELCKAEITWEQNEPTESQYYCYANWKSKDTNPDRRLYSYNNETGTLSMVYRFTAVFKCICALHYITLSNGHMECSRK